MVLRDDKSDDGYHWECPVKFSSNEILRLSGVL